MYRDLFYNIGKLFYKTRWILILLWLALLITCISFAPKLLDPFKSIGFSARHSESEKANNILNDKIGYSYNRFIIMFHSDQLLATDPAFTDEIKESLSNLKKISVKHEIIYPTADNKQISEDKHTAFAVVVFKSSQEVPPQLLNEFKTDLKMPAHLTMHIGGEPIFLDDTKIQTQTDLYKAEYIGTPAAIITMLFVFGSVVAALIPVVLGGVCALVMLFVLYILGHYFSLSVFTINIALLLGICLSLDYALLFVYRYRDELHRRKTIEEALAVTLATAGKSVFFSGLAVFISLSALLLFPVDILFSVGIGGLAAVSTAVLTAVILLPAILAILNNRINWLPIRMLTAKNPSRKDRDYRAIKTVVSHKFFYFFASLMVLLFLGYPFLHAQFGISDFRILPKTSESRQVFETFQKQFGDSKLAPIYLVIQTPKNILSKKNIDYLYDFADKIKQDPIVSEVNSIVTTTPRLTKAQYEMLYSHTDQLNPDLKKLLNLTTNDGVTVMTIVSKEASNSPGTYAFIQKLQKTHLDNNMTLLVTGTSANTIDVKNSIAHIFPYAFLWIVGFTYLILLIFLRSIILPLKAILMSILSLCASYGVLVLVIQRGFLHTILNFEPQGMLDISLLIIIFCALFGISMDYEVFLLTRIKEYYEQTNDYVQSIILGIDRSWRIITSAAIIVILICFSFMSADILMVKAFGLGIAIAVFIDAFVIRIILVPSIMSILSDWSWYLPQWLGKILPNIAFDPEKYLPKKRRENIKH